MATGFNYYIEEMEAKHLFPPTPRKISAEDIMETGKSKILAEDIEVGVTDATSDSYPSATEWAHIDADEKLKRDIMATGKSKILADDIEMGVTNSTSDSYPDATLWANVEAHEKLISKMSAEDIKATRKTRMIPGAFVPSDELDDWIEIMDMKANTPWMQEKLCQEPCIYKVPAFKRELNRKAFTPMVVSFGPFHYSSNPELMKMELYKKRAFFCFLRRAKQLHPSNSQNQVDLPLENITEKIFKIITQLRDAYSGLDDSWKINDDEFLKLMIVDGCFMLELLRFSNTSERDDILSSDHYFTMDEILHMWPYIIRDMLLIENQLPLDLLKALAPFQTTLSPEVYINCYINNLVLNFISGFMLKGENTNTRTMPGDEGTETKTNIYKLDRLKLNSLFQSSMDTERKTILPEIIRNATLGRHALDLFRKSLLSPTYDKPIRRTIPQPNQKLRCATELHEAGVGFKKSETNNLNDISFDPEVGNFYLPSIRLDDYTESIFLNILAFEHLHDRVNRDVTTYVCVMNALIGSAKDVRFLYDRGLIANMLGSDKQVAGFFNKIAKEVHDVDDSNLSLMKEEVFNYCIKKRNKWRAKVKKWIENLINTYFSSPWSILSLAGALLVIVLTFIQTIYAIRGK